MKDYKTPIVSIKLIDNQDVIRTSQEKFDNVGAWSAEWQAFIGGDD